MPRYSKLDCDEELYPQLTPHSREVLCHGPILVYYIPPFEGVRRINGHDLAAPPADDEDYLYDIQVNCGFNHRLFTTITDITIAIVNSKIPILVPPWVEVVVEGENCKIYHTHHCTVDVTGTMELTENSTAEQRPQVGILCLYAADVRRFGENIQVVLQDDVVAWVPHGGKVIVAHHSTELISYREQSDL
ncbi:unnamed protein product, partial [Mesorhabditis spiculigera]